MRNNAYFCASFIVRVRDAGGEAPGGPGGLNLTACEAALSPNAAEGAFIYAS